MRGYSDIDRSTSHCVTFVDECDLAEEDAADLEALVASIRAREFRIAYLDCRKFEGRHWEIPSEIGHALGLDHPPYEEGNEANLVRWLDDLISLAYSSAGVVIVLDHVAQLFASHRRFVTDLIEAFLVQVHHYLKQKVPCHLVLQMSSSPMVAKSFGQAGDVVTGK